MAGPNLLALVGLGAAGGILANIALTPLTAGASLLQSYYYGSGLILGERMMYTVHWEKIKKRLDNGEDFISVLDAIMNDDITAIANLSFKTMDETGKLYLAKGQASLGAFIESLIQAVLNPIPPVTNETETPPPTGEETEEGTSLTIDQLNAMTIAQLETLLNAGFETYNQQTIQHATTILAQKRIDETGEETSQKNQDALKNKYFEAETIFLQELSTWIFQDFIDSEMNQDQQIILKLGLITGTRNRSSGSDAQLAELQQTFSQSVRPAWVANPSDSSQALVNIWHMIIWFHQLTYI